MGLFLENYNIHQSNTPASNACFVNGNVGIDGNDFQTFDVNKFLQSMPSIFMWGLQQFGEDDSVGDAGAKGVSKETQKKIDDLNNKLTTEVYPKAGVTTSAGLDNLIKTQDQTVKDLNKKVTDAETIVGNTSSAQIQAQINSLYDDNENLLKDANGNPIQQGNVPSYNELITKRDAVAAAESTIAENKPKLEAEQVKLMELKTVKGEADNILLEINKLKTGDSGVSYDVTREKDDIKNFMDALIKFKDAQTPDAKKSAATALKTAYENSGSDKESGIQTKSITDAWKLVEKQVEAAMNA